MLKTKRIESNRKLKKSRDGGKKKDKGWHFNERAKKKSIWFCVMHWKLDAPFTPFGGDTSKSKDGSKKSKRSVSDSDNIYERGDSSQNNSLKKRRSH